MSLPQAGHCSRPGTGSGQRQGTKAGRAEGERGAQRPGARPQRGRATARMHKGKSRGSEPPEAGCGGSGDMQGGGGTGTWDRRSVIAPQECSHRVTAGTAAGQTPPAGALMFPRQPPTANLALTI